MFTNRSFTLICFHLAFLVCLSFAEVKEEGDVLVLNKDNFQQVVNEKDVLLVEFYAPWCGHCKQLEPQYSAAAVLLKPQGIALGKVDATVEESLASQHDVQGYPTLKIFKKTFPGETFDYNGPRDTQGIVKFMQTVAQPDWKPARVLRGLHRLSKANLTEQLDKQAAWIVGFVDPANKADALLALSDAADQLKSGREPKAVGYVEVAGEDAELARLYGAASFPTYLLIKRDSMRPVRFTHEATGRNLVGFFRAHSGPESTQKVTSLTELDKLGSGTESLLIGHFSSLEDSEPFRNFLAESSHIYQTRVEGGLVESAALAKQLGLETNAIYLRKPAKLTSESDTKLVKFPGASASGVELKKFYEDNRLPLVGYYTWGTKDIYKAAKQPVCLFFLTVDFTGELRTSTRMWHEKFAKVARKFAGKVLFAMADDEQDEAEAQKFKFEDSSADLNLGCYGADKRRFALPEMDGFDADQVSEFVTALLAGRLTPVLRSATGRAQQSGPLLHLTGATFQAQVLADSAPSCLVIQCDHAKPECASAVAQLAAYAASARAKTAFPGLRFAQLDTAHNDAPGAYFHSLDSEETPLVLLAAAGRRATPARFDAAAGIDHDELAKFLREQLPQQQQKTEL